jgi:hypothetical protein
LPFPSHWSEFIVLHVVHAPPALPHVGKVGIGVQLLPVQQPVPQDAASQTQEPPEHSWPAPHARPPLQVHAPAALQPSPVEPQPKQDCPPVPHCPAVVGFSHVLPLQQPPAHEVESHWHVPEEHRCPSLQVAHALPPVPQVVWPSDVWHMPLPSQQPVGQVVASQVTQLPPEHV